MATSFTTLVNKLTSITGYDRQTCETLLTIEREDGGIDAAETYIQRCVEHRRIHNRAEELWNAGYDPLEALDALFDAYMEGGIPRMEVTFARMRRTVGKQKQG